MLQAKPISPAQVHGPDQAASTPSIPSQQTDEPSSTTLSLVDTPVLIADDRQFTKDTRSYEHNRQRFKKAMSRLRQRAVKDRKASITPLPIPSVGKKEKHLTLDDVDRAALRNIKVPELESPTTTTTTRDPDHLSLHTAVFMAEVTLIDLIATRKSRKANKDGDFVVIPRVRSVIALDEYVESDSEIDEPWEHIQMEDKWGVDTIRKPTYAEIVSFTK